MGGLYEISIQDGKLFLKLRISIDSLSSQPHLDNTSLCIDYPVENCKIAVILFGSMLPNQKGH